jgi:hypothetical protein
MKPRCVVTFGALDKLTQPKALRAWLSKQEALIAMSQVTFWKRKIKICLDSVELQMSD